MNYEQLLKITKDLIEVLNKHYPFYYQLQGEELKRSLEVHNKIHQINSDTLNMMYPDRPRKDITLLKVEDFET